MTARFERGEQLEAYIATVMVGAQLRDLPAEQHRPLVAALAARLAEPVIDYV
jgi:trans-aconitate 2-methyltransferase